MIRTFHTFTLIALLTLSTAGCGDGADDNHGYGWAYDFETPSGIAVRCDLETHCMTADQVDTAYTAAQMCLGVSQEAGDLMLIATTDIPGGELGMFLSPALVLVTDTADEFYRKERAAHEMTHYLLERITGDADEAHVHPCFSGFTLARFVIDADTL